MLLTYPVLIFLLFNSRDLIVIYLGEKYSQSAIIFAIYNLTLLMRISSYNDVLIAAEKGRLLLYYYLFVFLLNCALNLLLINYFGIVGAAIATVLSLLVFAFLLLKKSMTLLNASILELFELNKVLGLFSMSVGLSCFLYFSLSFIEFDLLRVCLFATIYFSIVYYLLFRFNFFSSKIKEWILKALKLKRTTKI